MALRRRRRKITTILTGVDRRLKAVELRRVAKVVKPASVTPEQLEPALLEQIETGNTTNNENNSTVKAPTQPSSVFEVSSTLYVSAWNGDKTYDELFVYGAQVESVSVGDVLLIAGVPTRASQKTDGRRTTSGVRYQVLTKGTNVYGDYFSVRLDSTGPYSASSQVRSGQYTIVSKSSTATTATVKLNPSTYADEFIVNDAVVVAGLGDPFDGTFVVKSVERTVKLVTNKALTSNVATLTLGTGHGFVTGDAVTVTGVDATFNGTYSVSNFSSTTISYAKTATNVTSTAVSSVDAKATSAPQVSYDFNSPQSAVSPTLDAGTLSQTFALARNVGDTWVDTSTTPNELYWWDGREWKSGVPTGTVIDDGVAPSAPTALAATTSGYVDYKGPRSRVELSWTAPTTNADAGLTTLTDLAGYKVYYRYNTADNWQLTDDKEPLDTECTILGLTPAKTVYFTVKAYDISNNLSAYATAVSITTGTTANAMNAPSAPTVTSRLSTFTVKWNGLDSTSAVPPSEFSYVEVHVSTTTGFTPSDSTKIGALSSGNESLVYVSPTGTANGTLFYFKLIAVDSSDNRTSAGAQTALALARVSGPDLVANSITTNEIQVGAITADLLSATAIDGKTITGATIKTAASGKRTELSGTDIRFYASNGSLTGSVSGESASGALYTYISSYDGAGLITLGSGEVTMAGSSSVMAVVGGFVTASGTNVNVTGSSEILLSGNVRVSEGRISIDNASSGNTPPYNANYLQVPDTYVRTLSSGRIVYVASNGTFNSSSSSARYKQDIETYTPDLEAFFKLRPVSFRYKNAVNDFGEAATVQKGFIAEEADEAGMHDFVDYQDSPDGPVPDNFRYIDFTAALFSVVKTQQVTIQNLSDRLTALEQQSDL